MTRQLDRLWPISPIYDEADRALWETLGLRYLGDTRRGGPLADVREDEEDEKGGGRSV